MKQLRDIYYEPSYRLLIDHETDIIIVHIDGDFVQFDSKTLEICSRELISHPENRDDREQFIHLHEYKWNAVTNINGMQYNINTCRYACPSLIGNVHYLIMDLSSILSRGLWMEIWYGHYGYSQLIIFIYNFLFDY